MSFMLVRVKLFDHHKTSNLDPPTNKMCLLAVKVLFVKSLFNKMCVLAAQMMVKSPFSMGGLGGPGTPSLCCGQFSAA